MGQLFKRFTVFYLLILLCGSNALRTTAQVRPVYDMGAIGLVQLLKRLPTTASVLHTGAHPDDEDSGLLAYLARHDQARTAYLSLNRGEGGQNVIGNELFEPLGIIRTEELLQARRLDGGHQLFTSVMDYGFSKTRAEAARIWGEKQVLADMVRAIRQFRPLVIISRFSGTPADGHGQHQLAGYLTPIAFKAAADPNQFPEQIREGLRPWQAKKLYVSEGFSPDSNKVPSLIINTGEYDPLIGRTYFEIAMEGRSQHKSQEMGVLELRGKQRSGLNLLESVAAKTVDETDVFSGVDTSIKGLAKTFNLQENFLNGELSDIQNAAEKALKDYQALNPAKAVPALADGLKAIREARREIKEKLNTNQSDSLKDIDFILAQKDAEFTKALQMASGIVADALSESETIVPGDSTVVAVRVFGVGAQIANVSLSAPDGWLFEKIAEPQRQATGFRPRYEDADSANYFKLTAPPTAEYTQPYWLEKPRKNFTFDWTAEDEAKNMPFQKPLVTANVVMNIAGQQITVERPVEYRYADDIRGELRRDLNVVPAVSVGLESDLLIVPVAPRPQNQRIVMTITNHAPRETSGTAKLNLPARWKANPASATFALKKQNEKTALVFDVTVPANAKIGEYALTASAQVDGKVYDQTMRETAYPHIQTHRRYTKADVTAKVLNLKVAPVKVGYVMGSGDTVPEAIKRMGLSVTMLNDVDLSTGDLSKYDTIVIGVRASQVRPDLVANNGRLLDFVKNGGTLIVQYQQQEYVNQNLAPYPVKMDMQVNGTQRISNVRVTDENAPVRILEPQNPIFNYPNKINADDWKNWVQERNLYNLTSLDPRYTPLIESHDAGDPESTGGLVYAKIGKGNYIYNSYSFFRQLPKGNPGAYRLFANMLSLPKTK